MTTPSPNLETIGNLIRHWVHYDNSINALNKQIRNLRELKNNYESQVIKSLQETSMKNPVIQIEGGRILLGEDKAQQPLSYSMLEGMLNKYYAAKPGSRPETKEILKFIRDNRTSEVSTCLKRVYAGNSRSKPPPNSGGVPPQNHGGVTPNSGGVPPQNHGGVTPKHGGVPPQK